MASYLAYDALLKKDDVPLYTGYDASEWIIPYHAVRFAKGSRKFRERPTPADALCKPVEEIYSIIPVPADEPVSDDGELFGRDFQSDIIVEDHTITGTLLCNTTGIDGYGEGHYLAIYINPQRESSDAEFYNGDTKLEGYLTRYGEDDDWSKNVYFVILTEDITTLTIAFGGWDSVSRTFVTSETQDYTLDLTYEPCGD